MRGRSRDNERIRRGRRNRGGNGKGRKYFGKSTCLKGEIRVGLFQIGIRFLLSSLNAQESSARPANLV